jgi:hypothetical protein
MLIRIVYLYFPSIEKKYGRSIAEWRQIIADCGPDKHMAIVGYLKSEHGMGHARQRARRLGARRQRRPSLKLPQGLCRPIGTEGQARNARRQLIVTAISASFDNKTPMGVTCSGPLL